jgi:deferrochelatase/peroxidase EfeB
MNDHVSADAAQLKLRRSGEIQGNILAGFRKDHEVVIFLRFPQDPAPVRKWLNRLIPQIATTRQVAAFNEDREQPVHAVLTIASDDRDRLEVKA